MQLSQQLSQQQRLATARAHTSPHLNTNHQKHRSILSDRNVQAVSRLSHMYSLSVGGAAYTMLPAHPERCHRARSTTRVSLPQGIADSLMQILAQGSATKHSHNRNETALLGATKGTAQHHPHIHSRASHPVATGQCFAPTRTQVSLGMYILGCGWVSMGGEASRGGLWNYRRARICRMCIYIGALTKYRRSPIEKIHFDQLCSSSRSG